MVFFEEKSLTQVLHFRVTARKEDGSAVLDYSSNRYFLQTFHSPSIMGVGR
jgi:hypothetical protein